MEIIPQLISRYSIVLYAVCVIACAYFLFSGVASLRELRRAIFRLERSSIVSRAVSALLKSVLCVLIGVAIYVVTLMAPVSRTNALIGTPTSLSNRIVIPTSMPTAAITVGLKTKSGFTPTITFVDGNGTVSAAVDGVPSSTLAIEGNGLTLANELMADCTNPKVQFEHPASGEHISGIYSVMGTALFETGEWYKLEFLPPGASEYKEIGRSQTPVQGGVLFANFNASSLPPGTYPFRLAVVGADGRMHAYCRIPVTIG